MVHTGAKFITLVFLIPGSDELSQPQSHKHIIGNKYSFKKSELNILNYLILYSLQCTSPQKWKDLTHLADRHILWFFLQSDLGLWQWEDLNFCSKISTMHHFLWSRFLKKKYFILIVYEESQFYMEVVKQNTVSPKNSCWHLSEKENSSAGEMKCEVYAGKWNNLRVKGHLLTSEKRQLERQF